MMNLRHRFNSCSKYTYGNEPVDLMKYYHWGRKSRTVTYRGRRSMDIAPKLLNALPVSIKDSKLPLKRHFYSEL